MMAKKLRRAAAEAFMGYSLITAVKDPGPGYWQDVDECLAEFIRIIGTTHVIVPVEPTAERIDAAIEACPDDMSDATHFFSTIYKAMTAQEAGE